MQRKKSEICGREFKGEIALINYDALRRFVSQYTFHIYGK